MTHKIFFRIFIIIFTTIVLSNIISFIAFAFNPKFFYYRPWEYFSEVAYRFKEFDAKWDDVETSDLTRKNYFYFQDPHHTIVTTDKFGFRSVPFSSDNYEILVYGDSTIFGSGLSDNETLPWLLSEKLMIPVFNGARSTLSNTLQRNELSNVKIIIDCMTEREVKRGIFTGVTNNKEIKFNPIMLNDKQLSDVTSSISAQRYLLTSILLRTIKRLIGDAKVFLSGEVPEHLFLKHQMTPQDLNDAILSIEKKSKYYTSLGYVYIFIAIPAKQTLYDNSVDGYTKNYIHKLTEILNIKGIRTINLLTAFETGSNKALYRSYDTHWNGYGTDLAADTIANYIRINGLADSMQQ